MAQDSDFPPPFPAPGDLMGVMQGDIVIVQGLAEKKLEKNMEHEEEKRVISPNVVVP